MCLFSDLWEDLFNLEADLKLADTHMNSQDELIIYLPSPELQYEERFDWTINQRLANTHKNMLTRISLKVCVVQVTGEIKQWFIYLHVSTCLNP